VLVSKVVPARSFASSCWQAWMRQMFTVPE